MGNNGRDNAATGAQPYTLLSPATVFPVTLAELKAWLKVTSNSEDALLTMIIQGCTEAAELYTKRDFITKSYLTYRDRFGDYGEQPLYAGYPAQKVYTFYELPIVLRRSKLQSILSIKYWLDNVLTTWNAAEYYIVNKSAWSQVLPVDDFDYPSHDQRLQAIQIEFTAGYGATGADVPAALRMALLSHMASVYTNRGDCSAAGCSCDAAPMSARAVYQQYRIVDFVL